VVLYLFGCWLAGCFVWFRVQRNQIMDHKKVIALLAIASCAGCSATRQIAQSASQVSTLSERIVRQADAIALTSDQAEVVKSAESIRTDAYSILDHSQRIAISVTATKDTTPAWMTLVEWLAIAAASICAAWILTASGALGVVRAAVGWLPRRKVMDATLARSVMDDANPASIREYIAARRMSDAEFNAAFVASGKSVDSATPTVPLPQPR
jgi:outer membrane murein-binding lipoprotein Lpp